MRTVRYDRPGEMVAWAEDRIGFAFHDEARAIGLEQDGALVAVTLFDRFSSSGCNMHVVALPDRPWLTRGYARHVAAYPFIQCGFRRVTLLIAADNARAIRFAEHFGCTLEGRLREAAHNGRDELVYGLLRRECRWLPKTIGPLAGHVARTAV